MARFDTTVNLIASGTLALLTHPEEKSRLRQDPSLLPSAVEEKTDHVHAFVSAIPALSTGGPGSLVQLNEIPILGSDPRRQY